MREISKLRPLNLGKGNSSVLLSNKTRNGLLQLKILGKRRKYC